jgi:hypothetical protein
LHIGREICVHRAQRTQMNVARALALPTRIGLQGADVAARSCANSKRGRRSDIDARFAIAHANSQPVKAKRRSVSGERANDAIGHHASSSCCKC